jgi:hypothetical protein
MGGKLQGGKEGVIRTGRPFAGQGELVIIMKIKLTFFQQTSIITLFFVMIFLLVNLIGFSVVGVGVAKWIVLENTWTLPAFGIILLILIPFEREWTRYFQAFLFFLYGFLMICGKGINYDCIPLFFVGSLLLRKYGFFLKESFSRLPCLVALVVALCYAGHFLSGLSGSMGWENVNRCVALIVATTFLSCTIFRDDIRVYQDEKKKREDERLRQAGKILDGINTTLYRLISTEPDKSENICLALDLLKFIGIYAGPEPDEKKIEANLAGYVDFALIFSGSTKIIRNYEKIPPVKMYRHDFLISLVTLALKASKSMEKMNSKIINASIKKDGDSIKIAIRDSGAGLSKSEMRCLWENENMKQVAACIKRHGWEITAESLPALYTEFVIHLRKPL